MKTFASFKTLFCLAFAVFVSFSNAFATADLPVKELPPRWEKLGSRKVKYEAERDVISVTAYEGKFNAVRLKVEKSAINLHRFEIHYGNGDVQKINVRKVINAGTTTRAINLKGRGRRVINKVVFFYDTKGLAKKKATVELWGRRF